MTDIKNLENLLDWKLLGGSHEFPGPDGGTCINEAAMVAAGFPYHAITCVDQLPACFSKALGSILLEFNDRLPDKERQELKRYILRIAGTADSEEIEDLRAYTFIRLMEKFNNNLKRFNPVLGFAEIGEAVIIVMDNIYDCGGKVEPQHMECFHKIIETCFAIGKQADPLDIYEVQIRINKEKIKAHKRAELEKINQD